MREDFGGTPVFAAFRDRYREYLAAFAGKPNVTLLRYEDMVADFPGWLRTVVTAFDLEDPEAAVADLFERHRGAFDVTGEDVMRHKRQVVPGDHRRRLKAETVVFLTEQFAEILRELGYDSPAASIPARRTSSVGHPC
jgi:adenylate cyclase class IV